MAGNISLVVDGTKLKPKDAIAPLTKTPQWKNVKISKKIVHPKQKLEKAKSLGKELFGSIAPDTTLSLPSKSLKFRNSLIQWLQKN
jgi:hypothetical protein